MSEKKEEIECEKMLYNMLWKYIFQLCDSEKELKNLNVVNKRFNQILKAKEIWKMVVEKSLDEEFKVALNYLNDEQSFENVWKSFIGAEKRKQNSWILNKSTSYFSFPFKSECDVLVLKNKNGEELILLTDQDSTDFQISFFCGYLDRFNLATKRGFFFYLNLNLNFFFFFFIFFIVKKKGLMKNKRGNFYIGGFFQGKLFGDGEIKYKNGSGYKGNFDCFYDGEGLFIFIYFYLFLFLFLFLFFFIIYFFIIFIFRDL